MMQVPKKESLAERADRLRRMQRASSTGPLLIAEEVVQIANEWETYRKEAGGVDCTNWCFKALGYHLSYYQRRSEAVHVLGEAVRRTVSHDVAIWLVAKLSDEARDKAKLELIRECKRNNGHPVTKHRALRVLRAAKLIDPRKSRVCQRCEKLEKILKKNGIEFD